MRRQGLSLAEKPEEPAEKAYPLEQTYSQLLVSVIDLKTTFGRYLYTYMTEIDCMTEIHFHLDKK